MSMRLLGTICVALSVYGVSGIAVRGVECTAGRPYCYDPPVHLNMLINTSGFEGGPSLSADGRELYFVSDRPGAFGGAGDQDIYVTRRRSVKDDWGAPQRVPPPISSPFFDITPSISLDGLALYFASNRPGAFSPPQPDLWVARRDSVGDSWGQLENLGAGINTVFFEGSVSVSPDERTIFFAGFGPPTFPSTSTCRPGPPRTSPSVRGCWSMLRSTPTVTTTGLHSLRVDTR